jgi:hypothetical protein
MNRVIIYQLINELVSHQDGKWSNFLPYFQVVAGRIADTRFLYEKPILKHEAGRYDVSPLAHICRIYIYISNHIFKVTTILRILIKLRAVQF